MLRDNNIIFFDGVCKLCNSSVNFILKRDKHNIFKYSHLQSKYCHNQLIDYGISISMNTILFLEDGRLYEKSTAALRIVRKLGGIWPIFYVFIIIPKFIRDSIYNLIARYRYKWFGKTENCRVPSPEIKDRFIN